MTKLGGHNFSLTHRGKSLKVDFIWERLSLINNSWGEGYQDRAVDAFASRNIDDMAVLLAAGTGTTLQEIMEWSPPVHETARILQQSWTAAWLGDAHVSMILAQEQANEEDTEVDPPKSLLTKVFHFLKRLFSGRLKQGSAGTPSGSKLQPKPNSSSGLAETAT